MIDFEGVLAAEKAKADRVSMEALKDVFHRMPFGQKVLLSNGKVGTLTKLGEPKQTRERDDHLRNTPYFTFDIQFDDGSGHVEFVCYQSGWGASL